ncbi:hypothetical protein Tco_0663250 [Tanacetum coccineum]
MLDELTHSLRYLPMLELLYEFTLMSNRTQYIYEFILKGPDPLVGDFSVIAVHLGNDDLLDTDEISYSARIRVREVVYVLTTPMPELMEDSTVEAIRIRAKWENDDYIYRGHILNVVFPEFYKELEAEIFGSGAQLMGLQFIQLELRLGKTPSWSFRPVKSAKILWQFWASSSFGVSLAHDGSWSKWEPSLWLCG